MSISRDSTLMNIAQLWAGHSTCSRLAVGAVISRDGRSLTSGYNGAPAGLPHCDHSIQVCLCGEGQYQLGWTVDKCPAHGGCRTAVHAELNAIAFAARVGVAVEGAEIHCTHQPCLNCAMAVINAGIKRLVYYHPYRDPAGTNLLAAAGIPAERYIV